MANVIDAFIQALAAQVVASAIKQIKYATTCGVQFERMKGGLQTMNDLLSDTTHVRSEKKFISGSLNELRDIIYRADNALTDFLVRVDEIHYWKRHYIRYVFRLWFGNQVFLIQMGKDLEEINGNMDRIKGILSSHLSGGGTTHQAVGANVPVKRQSQDSPPSKTYGLDKDINILKPWITGCNNQGKLKRIGIWGMGGLGKTTIAQTLFHDGDVKKTFQRFVWVCVSQNFNEDKIMKLILGKLGRTVSEFDVNSTRSMLKDELRSQNYLIVMVDVWRTFNLSWWDALCSDLPTEAGKHSCIIITTRFEDVAKKSCTEIHRPDLLTEEDSWSLFSESAFGGPCKKSECPDDDLKELGEEILEKCGRLPLAIKTVGRLLLSKKQNASEWKETRDRFHDLINDEENKQPEEVMFSLQLSYDDLPIHLKQCLLCFAIYPEDFEIDGQQLIHWWIGEGLVHAKDSKTAVEMGYEYLTKLVSRCLVEDCNSRGHDGKVLQVQST